MTLNDYSYFLGDLGNLLEVSCSLLKLSCTLSVTCVGLPAADEDSFPLLLLLLLQTNQPKPKEGGVKEKTRNFLVSYDNTGR